MLKCKCAKNICFRFLLFCFTAIYLFPFSAKAQEDEAASKLVLSIAKVRKAAETGNTIAMVVLGDCYMFGRGMQKDTAEALKWYTKAADKEEPKSMFILGSLYDNGKAVPKDTALALKWYKAGADAGDANAQNSLGIKYRKGRWVARDYKKAMKLFKQSADGGNAYGMLNVGLMYQYAKAVKRDNKLALEWYLKAAEKSAIKVGCYNLGYFYEYGKGGLTADIGTAISFYNKALNKDEKAASMYRLGNIYEYGKGNIKADLAEAMKCYLASANAGNITGMFCLGHLYEQMQRNDEAIAWYKKAFDLSEKEIARMIDDTESMICLATMYEQGKGTEKNMELALTWYKNAAELGNEEAELKLRSLNGN